MGCIIMSKPKRNDPCPCGSGKKYKKCCGLNNVIEISPELYNSELDQIHEQLITVAMNNYEAEMTQIASEHLQPFLGESPELSEAYITGLTFWSIFNVPCLENNQTIFDDYYSKNQAKIKRTRTKNTFAEWGNTVPSAYEILSIDERTVTFIDMLTDKTYEIPYLEDDEENIALIVGNIAIGTLVPYVGHHRFFYNIIEMDAGVKDEISILANKFAANGSLRETFPDFLGEALMIGSDVDMEWDNPLHEMVAEYFSRHMSNKGYQEELILSGVLLWNLYCQKENPSFKKLGSYAAALEYLIYDIFFDVPPYTQTELAGQYETTAGTVSTNFRRLSKTLATDIDEMMEKVLMEDEDDDGLYTDTPTGNPFGMEKEMQALQKQLENQDFESEEEMHAFLDGLLSNGRIDPSPPESPRELAQDKFYEAVEAKGKKRQKLLQEALDIYPNSPDVYLLMAEDAKTMLEHRNLIAKAVMAGEKDLGEPFLKENKGHFWMMTETRPYMRAKEAYATILYTEKNINEALEQYEELLELNPNDNQGIRYTLLTHYIEAEMWHKAERLVSQYDDDAAASFAFNKALLHYFTKGMTSKTKMQIKAANKQNPYVKDYLLGKKKVPNKRPDYIGFGDEMEAIAYVQGHMHLWVGKAELLEELK